MQAIKTARETSGSLSTALAHASRLLEAAPDLAAQQALAILDAAPGHPEALLILGVAKRKGGDLKGSKTILRDLVKAQPRAAKAHFEFAMALAAGEEAEGAIASLRQAVRLSPQMSEAWRALGDLLVLKGDSDGANIAYGRQILASVHDPDLVEAAEALCEDRLAVAERRLRARLISQPTDVAAIRMLAEVGTRLGRYGDAEALLSRCLDLAPSYLAARHNYAVVLYRQNKAIEALVEIDLLLAAAPDDPAYRNLKAAALGLVGEYTEAIELYQSVLAKNPNQPKVWLSYGHALRTAGRQDECIDAYRRCLALAPTFGEAYWSLANLKTVRFDDADIAAMRGGLAGEGLNADDRLHLHYALGKALEDQSDAEGAFGHYAEGARIRRGLVPYDADETSAHVARAKALFTADFFAERQGWGCPDDAPIFVLGLPRSGSTLVEQILASHSMIEGTMELPEIVAIAGALGRRRDQEDGPRYPEALADLDQASVKALGERFIERTRVHRKLGRPYFIDKMPNNVLHVGLIRLILPNAKIIDARRHPMATCFSGFKQHFARGQNFSYDLTDIGRYYRDYVDLMAHFDAVQPGRVHRVIYEDTVEDTEGVVRRLLDYCGLAFEPGCLRFHENERAVRTASSEQVRRPIFREGLDQWRRFEPWLQPLKAALGPVLDPYPAPPDFARQGDQTTA